MKINLLTYCDQKYEDNRKKIVENAKFFKFNEIFSYIPKDIEESFFKKNYDILSLERGAGYWLWKPYFILKTLYQMQENDVLLYIDSGDSIKSEIVEYIKNIQFINILVPYSYNLQKKYTKRDCFVLMNCDEEKYWNMNQIEAGVILLKNTNKTRSIVAEWLKYCENKNILTDIPNISGNNFPEFIDHRHDQSILTNLCVMHNLTLDNSIRMYTECNVV